MNVRLIRVIAVLAGLALVSGLGTGCAKVSEKLGEKAAETAIEKSSGAKVDIDGDDVTIEGKDGTEVQIGTEKLPDGFPSEMPVEKDMKIIAGSAAPDGERGMGYTLAFYSKDTAAAAADWYAGELKKKGWKVTMTAESEGTSFIGAEKDEMAASITIDPADSEEGYKSQVSMVVVPKIK